MYENKTGRQILTHIEEIRRSVQRVFILRAAILLICLSSILLVLMRVVGLGIGHQFTMATSVSISVICASIVMAVYLRKQWQTAQDNAWLSALWRTSRDPDISEVLLSAMELVDTLSDDQTSDTTKQLIKSQLDNVWQRLSSIPPSECLPGVWTQVLRRGVVSVAVIVVSCLWLGDGLFTDPKISAVADEVPNSWVKGLTLTVAPPSYTGSDIRRFENTNGTINALSGSVIAGSGTTDSRKGEFVILLPDQSEIQTTNKDGVLSFSFTATQSGSWSFAKKEMTEEHHVQESGARTLTVLPDKAPIVELLKPKQDKTVSESDLLQLVYQARDDFGLVQSRLVVALDGDLAQAERSDLDPLRVKRRRGLPNSTCRFSMCRLETESPCILNALIKSPQKVKRVVPRHSI